MSRRSRRSNSLVAANGSSDAEFRSVALASSDKHEDAEAFPRMRVVIEPYSIAGAV